VQPLLNAKASHQVTDSAGQTRNVYQFPRGSIVDTNDQSIYEFPHQNIETDKIVASVQADLRSVAVALGLAEYMVSADTGNTSYSGGMIAEGPPVKTFETIQQDLADDDKAILTYGLKLAIKDGRLPDDALDQVRIDVEPASLVSRNRIQETQADQILHNDGAMSLKTWRLRNNLDNDEEDSQIAAEREKQTKEAAELAKKYPPPMAGNDGASAGGGTFAQRPNQPDRPARVTNRPFKPSDEPRQSGAAGTLA